MSITQCNKDFSSFIPQLMPVSYKEIIYEFSVPATGTPYILGGPLQEFSTQILLRTTEEDRFVLMDTVQGDQPISNKDLIANYNTIYGATLDENKLNSIAEKCYKRKRLARFRSKLQFCGYALCITSELKLVLMHNLLLCNLGDYAVMFCTKDFPVSKFSIEHFKTCKIYSSEEFEKRFVKIAEV